MWLSGTCSTFLCLSFLTNKMRITIGSTLQVCYQLQWAVHVWHIYVAYNKNSKYIAKISFLQSHRIRRTIRSTHSICSLWKLPFHLSLWRISFLTHFPFGDFLSNSKPPQVSLSLKKKIKRKIKPPSVLYSPLTCCSFLFLSYLNFSKVEYICCLFSSPLLFNYCQDRSHPTTVLK